MQAITSSCYNNRSLLVNNSKNSARMDDVVTRLCQNFGIPYDMSKLKHERNIQEIEIPG